MGVVAFLVIQKARGGTKSSFSLDFYILHNLQSPTEMEDEGAHPEFTNKDHWHLSVNW